jgi:hypothetical protein
MKMLLSALFIFLLTLTILLGFGIGLGFLLHWIVPSLEIGIATLIGIVATGISIRFLSGLMATMPEEGEEEEEGSRVSDRVYLIEPSGLRRRRRKKVTR